MPVNRANYRLDEEIDRLNQTGRLNSWAEFVDELKAPSDLFPALASNRTELLALVQRRPLTAEEHDVYLRLIEGLMKTNQALREHAQGVATAAEQIEDLLRGARNTALRLVEFANFRKTSDLDD